MIQNIDVRNDTRFYLARKRVTQIYCKKYSKKISDLVEEDQKMIDSILIKDLTRGAIWPV